MLMCYFCICEIFGFCIGFGSFDDYDFICFGVILCCDFCVLCGVDFVYRLFDSRVRRDVRYERVYDLIFEFFY